MDSAGFLTTLGVLATIVLGGWSIYLATRQRYPGRLSFVKESCLGLFDSIVKNLPELSVLYEDTPVKENLVLLKAYLLNTGRKDIAEGMTEEPLHIVVPDSFRCVTARVVSSSPNVRATVNIMSDTTLQFDIGLFRCDEHIRLEALVEVPEAGATPASKPERKPSARLVESLTFHHRIADTGKVHSTEIPPRTNRRLRRLLSIAVLYLVGLPLVYAATYWYLGRPGRLDYQFESKEGKTVHVRVSPRLSGQVRLNGVGSPYEETMSLQEFTARNMGP
jgi:hypothetical protein